MSSVKGILEFDLTDPDARQAHTRAVKADTAYSCLYDVSQLLRKYRKYSLPEEVKNMTLEEFAIYMEEQFWKQLADNGIDLDEEYT